MAESHGYLLFRSVPSTANQVSDLSRSPEGYEFYGRVYKLNWPSVADLLGKVPDGIIAQRLGCTPEGVRRMRNILRIPRYSKRERIVELAGTMPDAEVAREVGASAEYVGRIRREEGIPYFRSAGRRRDRMRLHHARVEARRKEKHGPHLRVL